MMMTSVFESGGETMLNEVEQMLLKAQWISAIAM
jgi:hypothetical protein